jgi:3-hydroxybutyryl-CoA dehydrogenase
MKNIAVIGAGTMGNGIAHTFAQFNYKVQLIDVSEKSLKKGMGWLLKNELLKKTNNVLLIT